MKTTVKITVFVIFSLLTQLAISAPGPAKSEYLESAGGGFTMNGNAVTYALSVEVIKELPANSVLKVEFQNPQDKQAPLNAQYDPVPKGEMIHMQSAPLECIENGKSYSILVKIIQKEDGKVLSEHKQELLFGLPKELLAMRGIQTC